MKTDSAYELVVQPTCGWLRIDWQGLVHYRDLLFLLVRRDFLAQYKQTILGPLWFIVQPLLTTLVFTVVFGKVARISTDGLPPMLFYLCGTLAWGYFAGCLGGTSITFLSNAGLFGKVYFPRLIVPLSVVISRLFAFGIQLATFVAFLFYFKFFTAAGAAIHVRWAVLLLPALLLHSALLGLGVGLWITALTTKYRDFSYLSQFLTQLWMYATPVIYPFSTIPERWRGVVALNPMTSIVETYRCAFLGVGTVSADYVALSVLITLVLLVTALAAFSRAERTFVDTI